MTMEEQIKDLDEVSQQFIRDAEKGGMRWYVENGEVCAWGIATDGIFSMDVDIEKHSCDGFIVTLPNT